MNVKDDISIYFVSFHHVHHSSSGIVVLGMPKGKSRGALLWPKICQTSLLSSQNKLLSGLAVLATSPATVHDESLCAFWVANSNLLIRKLETYGGT